YAWLHTVPALALSNALKKAGLDVGDLELVEINEAFAAVALNVTRMLALDEERVNVNGGAVALGHPIGASGARLVLTVANAVKRETGFSTSYKDQRLYRQERGGAPRAITPEADIRHADMVIDEPRNRLIAVREDHTTGAREAVNTIVSLDALGQREPTSIA